MITNPMQINQINRQKQKKYSKINAYTQRPSFQQIITIFIIIVQITIHSIFVIPIIVEQKPVFILVLLGFFYLKIIILTVDYIIITKNDPVDNLVIKDFYYQKNLSYPFQTYFCKICNSNVQMSSYHCNSCKRCSSGFDHHCKYLNNCIGRKNYQIFFRLISIFTLYHINLLVQSFWAFFYLHNNANSYPQNNKWIIVALIIISCIVGAFVLALLIFHIYISLCINTTTFLFNHNLSPNYNNQSQNKLNIKQMQNINSAKALKQIIT